MLQRFLLNCKITCAFILMGMVSFPAFSIDEYAIKSTLVLNFIKFIEWPDGGGGKKFNIGKINLKTKYNPSLQAVLEGITKKGKMPKIVSGGEFRPIIINKKGGFRL